MHTPYCTPATHVWHPVTPDFEVCKECRESRVRPVAVRYYLPSFVAPRGKNRRRAA